MIEVAQAKNKKESGNDQINFGVVIIGLLCIFALIAGGLVLDNYLEKNSSNNNTNNGNNNENNSNSGDKTYTDYVADFEAMSVTDYLVEIKENKTKVAYIGRSSCPACTGFVPILNKVANDYDVEIIYMNSDEINKSQNEQLTELFDSIGNKFEYIPMLMVTKNGKLLDSSSGGKDEEALINYLKAFDIIK